MIPALLFVVARFVAQLSWNENVVIENGVAVDADTTKTLLLTYVIIFVVVMVPLFNFILFPFPFLFSLHLFSSTSYYSLFLYYHPFHILSFSLFSNTISNH